MSGSCAPIRSSAATSSSRATVRVQPAVDERQPVAVAQHVDVDRAQGVGGERQGHPEHVVGDVLRFGAAPGVAVVGIGHAAHGAVPVPARRVTSSTRDPRRTLGSVRSNLSVR